jgi:hypothetical protein
MLAVLAAHYGLDAWPRIDSRLPGRNVRHGRDRWNHYLAERTAKDPARLDEDLLAWRMGVCCLGLEPQWQTRFASAVRRASQQPPAARMIAPRAAGQSSKVSVARAGTETDSSGRMQG